MSALPPLWKHQREAFQFVRELWSRGQNGAMLAMAMGTGKSRVTVELALNDDARRVLIVSPLRVVQVWEEQLARFAPGHYHVLALDERGGTVTEKQRRAAEYYRWSQDRAQPVVIAVNYDSARVPPFGDWAATRLWDLVIADESHRMKEPRGRGSKWLAKVGLMARRRLALTGTPMPHEPTDIWGQFRFLNPYHLERSFGQFESRYAIKGGYYAKQTVSWQNLDELEARFRQLAFRVTDSVLDLPGEMDETRTCDMGPRGARMYDEMEREMIAWIEANREVTAANPLVRLVRLQQITGGGIEDAGGVRHWIDHAKEDLLSDLLKDLGEPVVVFCRFKSDLEAVHRAALGAGLVSHELSGARDQLAQWRTCATPGVLAVQIQAGGVGVDLTRARIAIYYSLDFSLANYLQSRARIRRPPQQRPCVFYHLHIRNSIDQYILRAVHRREALIESVLNENDLADEILRQLKAKAQGGQHAVAD